MYFDNKQTHAHADELKVGDKVTAALNNASIDLFLEKSRPKLQFPMN